MQFKNLLNDHPFFLNHGYHPKYLSVIPNQVNVPRAVEIATVFCNLEYQLAIPEITFIMYPV